MELARVPWVKPRVLKFITAEEHARQTIAVDANVKFDPSNHLVPFEVLEHKEGELSKECILMPCYNFTLSLVLSPTLPIKRLWNEMKVAVTYLHSMGLLSFWGRQRIKQEIQNLAKELDFLQELYDHLEQEILGSVCRVQYPWFSDLTYY